MYKEKKCGSFGDISILSFNGNKIITTSGGGMLLSKNIEYVKKAKFLASQAKEKAPYYEHKELGYNYRLSNILAAIGCGQIERINRFISNRRNIFKQYFQALSKIEPLNFMEETTGTFSNRWLSTLTIDPKKTDITNLDVIKALSEENIESRLLWKPMHLQPLYKGYNFVKTKKYDISKTLFDTGLCLPSGSDLSKKDQNRIIDIISSLFSK
jgi:pyridoxal phosphate-dependent aminotransferase EpsN